MMGLKKRSSFALVDAGAGEARFASSLFRKMARFVSRLVRGDVDAPRRAGVLGVAVMFAATGAYGMVLGGHTQVVVKEATSRLGFAIGEIKVTGHKETSEIDVLEALELDGATSLIGFDSEAARQRILSMPWIASAQVTKLYPDGVSVQVTEKQPFAVWQFKDELALVEKDGKPIITFTDEKYAGLPLVIGDGANVHAAELVAVMEEFSGLATQARAYARIGDRRWDIILEDGLRIQLPENGLQSALSDAVTLEQSYGLLVRDIEAIDLRINDRVVVKLTAEAQSVRDATVKDSETRKKKSEAHI
jgi:cell division protein FtsQ